MPRAIFLDVDGTLITHEGRIPESARAAVRAARENGHRLFLATGRSPVSLWNDVHELGFDGAVTGAGARVEVDGELLHSSAMSADQVNRVVDYLDSTEVAYILESVDGLIGNGRMAERVRLLLDGEAAGDVELSDSRRFLESIQTDTDPLSLPVHKVGIYDSPVPLDTMSQALGGEFVVIPATVSVLGRNGGELSPSGVHKALGIDIICEYLGIDRADTVAFGDGMNDLEMLAHAGLGVAMGGAPPAVVDAADALTGAPHEDGIRDAFVRFGLIEAHAA